MEVCAICYCSESTNATSMDISTLKTYNDHIINKGYDCTCKCVCLYHSNCLDKWHNLINCAKCPICKIVSYELSKTKNVREENRETQQNMYTSLIRSDVTPNYCCIDKIVENLIHCNDCIHEIFRDSLATIQSHYIREICIVFHFFILMLNLCIIALCVLMPYLLFKFIQETIYVFFDIMREKIDNATDTQQLCFGVVTYISFRILLMLFDKFDIISVSNSI